MEDQIKLKDITIYCDVTTVFDLRKKDYTIANVEEEFEEEFFVTTCNLNKGKRTVAVLHFIHEEKEMTMEKLDHLPISLVFLKDKDLDLSLKSKIAYTSLVHLVTAGLFFVFFSYGKIYAYIQHTNLRVNGARAPLGMILLTLPGLLVTLLWGGLKIHEKKPTAKILLSLWLVLNIIFTITYSLLIDHFFTHRFLG